MVGVVDIAVDVSGRLLLVCRWCRFSGLLFWVKEVFFRKPQKKKRFDLGGCDCDRIDRHWTSGPYRRRKK